MSFFSVWRLLGPSTRGVQVAVADQRPDPTPTLRRWMAITTLRLHQTSQSRVRVQLLNQQYHEAEALLDAGPHHNPGSHHLRGAPVGPR